MSNQNQEKLSALLDDELEHESLKQVFADVEAESKTKRQFSRYALIGDVMRKEQELMISDDFASRIQAAVADLDMEKVPEPELEPALETVTAISSHPSWAARMSSGWQQMKQSKTARGSAQFAIAASVALVAVFGVNNMQQQSSPTAPVLTPVPLVQGLSPVSTDGLREKPSANQVTQSRINALMADHNQQVRLSDDSEKQEKDKDQSSEIDK